MPDFLADPTCSTARRDELAIQYNDHAVLENMHAAELFKLLQQKRCSNYGKYGNMVSMEHER